MNRLIPFSSAMAWMGLVLMMTMMGPGSTPLDAQEAGSSQNASSQQRVGTFEAEVRGSLQFNLRGRAQRLQVGGGDTQLFSGLVLQLQGGGGYSHCTLTVLENGTGRDGAVGTYPITGPADSLPGQTTDQQGFQAFFGCQTPNENYYYQAREGAIELRSFQEDGSVDGRIGLIAQRRGARTGPGETIRIQGQFFAQSFAQSRDADTQPPEAAAEGNSPPPADSTPPPAETEGGDVSSP